MEQSIQKNADPAKVYTKGFKYFFEFSIKYYIKLNKILRLYMDSISVDDDKININKKYLVVKIPAQVENKEKCIELLGGKDKIATKVIHKIY